MVNMDTYESYYASKQNCLDDILLARQNWGKSFQSDEQIKKTLFIISLYCPEAVSSLAESAFREIQIRMELLYQ